MSFLSRYWNAVQRQHSDTGMNIGDIVIDLAKLKDTEVVNGVEPNNQPTHSEPNSRPTQDGIMPRSPEELERKFERGSARPTERFQDLENDTSPIREKKVSRNPRDETKRQGRDGSGNCQTKKTSRQTAKLQKKLLKKLGAGHRVNIRLDKVVVNGETHERSS